MTNSAQEAERLAALYALELLDTGADREYTELVELAAELCAVPISTVSLIDSKRQWFKAAVGLDVSEVPRETSFCTHALYEPDMLLVENALEDERFRDNPLVTADGGIRFYAGVPLLAGNQPVGTLCVVDTAPRTLTESQRRALKILARQAQSRLELHAKQKLLERMSAEKDQLSRTLEVKNALFEAFMDNGPFVSYIKDADGRFVFYNAKLRENFHVEGDAWLGRTDSELFPAEIADKFREHDLMVMRGGVPVMLEESTPGPEGTTLTWHSYKFPIVNEQSMGMLAGISVEKTEENRRKAELERTLGEAQELSRSLAHSQAMLRTLLENNPNQCYMKDEDGRYLFYNPKFAEHFGIDERKWLGRTDFDLVPVELAERLRAHDVMVLDSDHVVETVGELAGGSEDGKVFKVLKFRCVDQDGRRMLASVAVDISGELEQQAALRRTCVQLEEMASVDGLTGVLNRRAFDARLEEEFIRAENSGTELSLILLDIDNFKQRNDRYGHAAGDQVLRQMGRALQGCCRRGDLVARVGGEEFAFLLPRSGTGAAELVAERVLLCVRAIPPDPQPITVSVGVATLNATTRSADRLYSRADDAMYRAKRLGKDRLVIHSAHLEELLRGVAEGLVRRGDVYEQTEAVPA